MHETGKVLETGMVVQVAWHPRESRSKKAEWTYSASESMGCAPILVGICALMLGPKEGRMVLTLDTGEEIALIPQKRQPQPGELGTGRYILDLMAEYPRSKHGQEHGVMRAPEG